MEVRIKLRPGQHQALISRLQELYDYIADYQLSESFPPAKKHLLARMGVDQNTLYIWLKVLEGAGYVKMYIPGYWGVVGIQYTDKRDDK